MKITVTPTRLPEVVIVAASKPDAGAQDTGSIRIFSGEALT